MRAPNPALHIIAQRILALLPTDGAPVLNRVMRVMLSRDLRVPVSAESFFEARDLLFQQGKVGRLRGQGGQLFLVQRLPSTDEEQSSGASPQEWTEAELMGPLRHFLEGPFQEGLDLPKGSTCIVHDTSQVGPALGRWARPDFILVTAMKFKIMPGSQIDVHSFELKTETGATDLAVYEALAQTRFTHFGHLVWHLPKNSKAEARLADIEQQCDEHGIGLIRIFEPSHPDESEILLDPIRKQTLAAAVDGFLESRLTAEHCEHLRRARRGG
jgi:hypothetical protein